MYLYSHKPTWYRDTQYTTLQYLYYIKVREYRRGNQEWTIQRHWQDQDEPNKNTTQYMFDTTMCKQTTGDKDESNIVFMRKS
jgi:hypothetical protein